MVRSSKRPAVHRPLERCLPLKFACRPLLVEPSLQQKRVVRDRDEEMSPVADQLVERHLPEEHAAPGREHCQWLTGPLDDPAI